LPASVGDLLAFYSSLGSSLNYVIMYLSTFMHYVTKIFEAFSVMFHSENLASLNFNKNKILSPGLEKNHKLKCSLGNFPTKLNMSRLMEKYQINI
jgi:hypothetical protein